MITYKTCVSFNPRAMVLAAEKQKRERAAFSLSIDYFKKIPACHTARVALCNLVGHGEEWHGFGFDYPVDEVLHLRTSNK